MGKFLFVGLLIAVIFFSGCILLPKPEPADSECFAKFIVSCSDNSKVIKDKILCSIDADCSKEKMENYCKPGKPTLAVCPDTNYYCGENGFCKGCNCVE